MKVNDKGSLNFIAQVSGDNLFSSTTHSMFLCKCGCNFTIKLLVEYLYKKKVSDSYFLH